MNESEQHTVQKGDTLMKIAFETYGDLFQWRKIFENNREKIQDPNHVPPGTVLRLEKSGRIDVSRNGEKYLIKNGDTLGTISNEVYGTPSKWKRLWENNRQLIHNPNKIFAGFYLYYTMTPEDEQHRKQDVKSTPVAHDQSAPTGDAAAAAPADGDRDPASVNKHGKKKKHRKKKARNWR